MGIFDSFLGLAPPPTPETNPELYRPSRGPRNSTGPRALRGPKNSDAPAKGGRRPEHAPVGDVICERCGVEVSKHRDRNRPSHIPSDDGNGTCTRCGIAVSKHRPKAKKRDARKPAKVKIRQVRKSRHEPKQDIEAPFLGIDGEGRGRYPHVYTLLTVVSEYGDRWFVENEKGLSTVECLNFILSLPPERYIFGYALGYDWTKILADVDDKTLYLLFRPELRARSGGQQRAKGPRAVKWSEFELNLQGSKFTIKRGDTSVVVWDIFKFFQGKFVNAIKDWKVGNEELWARMSAMKLQRGEFEHVDAQKIRDYCAEECQCMAQLARKLVDAHTNAGLELTNFYGAGSSAAAILKKMGIKEKMVDAPEEMREAIAAAFFGGRFENSAIGEIEGPIYNHDISSAYPYQTYFLPCLVHATWRHITRREHLEGAKHALVRYYLQEHPRIEHWAPFPFRDKKGNICYPYSSGGGYVWLDEYLAGEAGFPENVKFLEAWILETHCDCHPFKDVAHYYRERCRIGKEGPGIVMKLGVNSVYGKIAQSVGNGVYNNWVWAGMITSGCRAQLLNLICAHKDRSNCLMVATDGVFTREEIPLPTPMDTETWAAGTENGGPAKPLGGWETKVISQNVFIARPGIYFPMNPTKSQLKDIKGRGVGKSVVFDNWKLISDSWNKYGMSREVEVANVSRFCGAKTSLSQSAKNGELVYKRATGKRTKSDPPDYEPPMYGEWVSRKVGMSFDPMPKRAGVMADNRSLILRGMGKEESVSYKKAGAGQEDKLMKEAMDVLMEQPDAELEEVM